MTWDQVYQTLSEAEKMIMDMAQDNRIDLTELANLQYQKQAIETNFNEVIYGRD